MQRLLTPQDLPKCIYLSPPLIFPTTSNGIRTKNRPVWITPGAAPIRWMGPIRNPRWEQKRTEGYVIVSSRYPALPFSRPLQSKIVFSVSHPTLAFLYQIDFFQLVLVPIMHEILATER